MFKNALVSVSDKTGIVEFLSELQKKGLRIVSTGGTAQLLKSKGLKVVDVSEQTGFPEVMDGRVKTLHPNVHMCLLARDNEPDDMALLKKHNLEPFDLVIGNLYPFQEAAAKNLDDQELTEYIDIGGPSFLRAAAKSYSRITVLCDPEDYPLVLQKQSLSIEDRKFFASKLFQHVAQYDAFIAQTLGGARNHFSLTGEFKQELRYGENPQQKASWYSMAKEGLHEAEILQGKPLSYNNILDLEAAVQTLKEFNQQTACVAVKHNNPCAVAVGADAESAVKKSLQADPVSVFGGIVALNQTLDEKSAEALSQLFLECIIAPTISEGAKKVFSKKNNLRVLAWPQMNLKQKTMQVRTVEGGFLVQSQDQISPEWQPDWQIWGQKPSPEILANLMLAWKVCARLKSNAIAIVADLQTIGLGMGQVNRVDAVEQAIQRAKHFHQNKANWVLASDAFFPFPDSIEKAHQAGIKWIIQPGGSIKDQDVKSRAQELGVNVIITGVRHFLH